MFKRDIKKETEKIVDFIKDTFAQKGFTKAVIGISGGLDSSVIAALCVKALGKENVIGLLLPCGEQTDIEDSKELVKHLDISSQIIDIEPMVHSNIVAKPISRMRLGNIMARCRMIVLYDMSAQVKGLVVGTSNRTELLTGYFTMYGDGACALEPIGHLYKTEVRQLAKYLKIPSSIIDKAPSAGLWEGQTDEEEIGMTYLELDTILYLTSIKKNDKLDEFISLLNIDDKQKTKKVLKLVEKNRFKLLPPDMLKE